MKKMNNKSGFTLIEIIVVLIIIGILAAIALPNLFSNVQKSKAAQAVSAMDSFKSEMEGCLAQNSTTAPGSGNCTLAGQNLLTTAGIWSFSIAASGSGATAALGQAITPAGNANSLNSLTYSFVASDGTNTVTLIRQTTGVWLCTTGTANPYTGVC